MINNHVESTKFLWLTNLPAPYRLPIWDSIGNRGSLKVIFSMKDQNYRNWNIKGETAFTFEFLSKPSLRLGELDLIFGASGTNDSIKCADVVFVGGWDSFFYIKSLKYSRKIKKPTILFYESTRASHRFNGFFVRKLRSWVFSLADHVVTVGPESTQAALDIGVPSSKILTLFNPVDVAWFADFASENRVINRVGHHFLYVGQLIARKNVGTLIEAFSKICEPDDRLTIVGDGPLAEELKSHTREIGLDGVVEFTGNQTQEQVGLEYARANTLILPSTNEVWGLVVNEALACGLHVVVSRAAGVAEFIELMEGAFITDPEVDQMAKALESSRAQWSGPIPSPEIMAFTPEKFADAISVLAEDLVSRTKVPSLIWLTNTPMHYRIPIWKQLNAEVDFELITLTIFERQIEASLIILESGIRWRNLNLFNLQLDEIEPIFFNWIKVWNAMKSSNVGTLYMDGYESPAFFVTAWLVKRNGSKLIIGYRSTRASHRFNGFFVRKLRSWVFSLADHVVTVGPESTQAALDIGVPSSKILTLFNPVDVAWFADFASENRVINRVGHHFLYVGQLIARKNVGTLIEAFSRICEPNDRLTIVGEGPLAAELKSHTSELGLEGVIEFTGNKTQEEVAFEYARANTFILPSTNEVWGLVVNEALACGLHVVVSRAAGVAEFVESMKGVFISDPEVDQIADSMKRSREQWNGSIQNPEIMAFTPEKFAEAVSGLVDDLGRKL